MSRTLYAPRQNGKTFNIRNPEDPATEKQHAFMLVLLEKYDVPDEWAKQVRLDVSAGTTKGRASKWIGWMQSRPLKPQQSAGTHSAPGWDPTTVKPQVKLTPGLYELDGAIFRVKPSRSGIGPTVQKVHIEAGQKPRYSHRALYREVTMLKVRGSRLSVERAASLGLQTGWCVVCGRELSDPASVQRGIGPVCADRQAEQAEADE